MENNYETPFWKSQHFFKKSERTQMLGPAPSPVRFCSLFNDPLPPSLNERAFWMNPVAMAGILCDDIMSEWSTILSLKSLAI